MNMMTPGGGPDKQTVTRSETALNNGGPISDAGLLIMKQTAGQADIDLDTIDKDALQNVITRAEEVFRQFIIEETLLLNTFLKDGKKQIMSSIQKAINDRLKYRLTDQEEQNPDPEEIFKKIEEDFKGFIGTELDDIAKIEDTPERVAKLKRFKENISIILSTETKDEVANNIADAARGFTRTSNQYGVSANPMTYPPFEKVERAAWISCVQKRGYADENGHFKKEVSQHSVDYDEKTIKYLIDLITAAITINLPSVPADRKNKDFGYLVSNAIKIITQHLTRNSEERLEEVFLPIIKKRFQEIGIPQDTIESIANKDIKDLY